jgi:hypothetical protein
MNGRVTFPTSPAKLKVPMAARRPDCSKILERTEELKPCCPAPVPLAKIRAEKIPGKVVAALRNRNPPVRPKVPPAITHNSPIFSPRRLMGI